MVALVENEQDSLSGELEAQKTGFGLMVAPVQQHCVPVFKRGAHPSEHVGRITWRPDKQVGKAKGSTEKDQ